MSEERSKGEQKSGLPIDFLSRVSHDMRSPLSVVAGAFSEIRSDFGGQLKDEHQRLLSLAERGVARLLRLAEKLSLAARHDQGQIELVKSRTELGPAVRTAVANQLAVESRRAVEVLVEAQDTGGETPIDVQKLGYALGEIVGNAVRHARSRVKVTCTVSASQAEIAVEDDGEGVPEELRAKIFQRFAPTQSRSGLGLGLALSNDIVEAHGGKLAVGASTLPAGRPGTVGARFVITLPR